MFVLYFIGMRGSFKRPAKKQGGPRTFDTQVVVDKESYNNLLLNHQELKETVERLVASQTVGCTTCSRSTD